jgi:hypothetical protein
MWFSLFQKLLSLMTSLNLLQFGSQPSGVLQDHKQNEHRQPPKRCRFLASDDGPCRENDCTSVVSKVCSADPNGYATSSHGIRGYTSVMAALKFTHYLN